MPSSRRLQRAAIVSRDPAAFGARPTDIPELIVGRPSGPGYQRYEDLYVSGDTITQTLERCAEGATVTFPPGVFWTSDFPASQGYASIRVPGKCGGIIGSGKGVLGDDGSNATVFKIRPNTSTYSPPAQGGSAPSLARIMMRFYGHGPAVYANFQVAGTEQIVNGKTIPYNGLCDYDPSGKVVMQDLLVTGWYGDNGAPPGETFAYAYHGKAGGAHGHLAVRLESDGRRSVGGRVYGTVAMTYGSTVGGYVVDCNFHHSRAATWVGYQAFNIDTYDCIFDQSGVTSADSIGRNLINHERTNGIRHFRPKLLRGELGKGTHITHSNDTWSAAYDGVTRSVADGTTTIIDPTYTDIYGNGRMYLESWDPYQLGTFGTGDSMRTPPKVLEADGITNHPYMWIHGEDRVYVT